MRAGNRLVILDLSAHGAMTGYLLARARQAVGGESGATLLLHDPNSRGAGADWGRADLVLPSQLISPGDRTELQEWTHRVSDIIVREHRALFPDVPGCDFGALMRLSLETYLHEYALLAFAAAELHSRKAIRTTRILTSDHAVAHALSRVLPSRVSGRGLGRPKFLRRALALLPRRPESKASRLRLGEPDSWRAARLDTRPKVLLVVESTPMDQMFEPVEACLDQLGVVPRVRLDYSRGLARVVVEAGPDGAVICLGRPDEFKPADPFRFLGMLPDALRAAEALESDPRLAWLGGPVPLTYWLENAYLGELATITDQMARARDIIETLRPDLVVVGNDRWWLGQSYVQAAQTAGVPTLWVQDGIPIDSPVYFWMRADRLAASSEWVPEVLARYGIAPDRYQVTGQPRYDKLVAMARTVDRDASRQKLGLVPGRRYALLATQPLQSPAYAREVLEALLRVPDLFILLRPHPSQPREDLTELMATMPADRVSFHPGDSVFDLLAACDLMVNQFSTVTIEAAILGRPTITANFSGIPDPVPFARFGLSTAARSMADITTVTQRILDDGGAGFRATEEGMRRLVGPTDEGSARRVAEIIAGMVPA